GELLMGVGHVECLVSEDGVEDPLRLGVCGQDVLVEREAAGSCLLRKVEKCEQRRIVLAIHSKIVEASLAGGEPVGLEARPVGSGHGPDQRAPTPAEDVCVPLLVQRMAQEQSPEQAIAGELGCSGQVSTAVGLRLCEAEKLARASTRISPD